MYRSFFAVLLLSLPLHAAEPTKSRYETRKDHDPNGIGKFYLDREIAHVMGHQAANWLERPEREKEEQPKKLLKALKIEPGMHVADIGAGSGYHVFRMAPLVGDKGKVFAVDVQKEMIALVEGKAKKHDVKNVKAILSTEKDPKLPENAVDLIIMVDVYHELEFPYEMMEKMVASLKPGGRIAFVEFRLEDPKVPIKLVHKMTERQVMKEMAEFETAMEHAKTVKTLPWQHIVIFKKKEAKK